MQTKDVLLIVDAVINYALGVLCLCYRWLAAAVGVPLVENAFYPNILGGVLCGIGIALTIEIFRKHRRMVGLGLGGAVAINLSGGLVLLMWLLFGRLELPLRGQLFLWLVGLVLVGVSSLELWHDLKRQP
jgi:hypothetical protein